MEQIQNQETNTIVIDDGSKEYDIKNHYGENLAVFRFRPADTNIISRYEEVQQYFANFTTDEKETVTECEQRVIEKMDYLMGADTGSTFFSILGPFSPMANGKLFVEVCMDTLCDVINKEFDVRIKRTQSRVSKYTQKYQQHKPNYTKKRRRHGDMWNSSRSMSWAASSMRYGLIFGQSDILRAMADPELNEEDRIEVLFDIFFLDAEEIPQEYLQEAIDKAFAFIDCGISSEGKNKARLMDWDKDSSLIASAINKNMGKDIPVCEVHALVDVHGCIHGNLRRAFP